VGYCFHPPEHSWRSEGNRDAVNDSYGKVAASVVVSDPASGHAVHNDLVRHANDAIPLQFARRKVAGALSGRTERTELLRHPEELKQAQSKWMPWNYRKTLARLAQACCRVI